MIIQTVLLICIHIAPFFAAPTSKDDAKATIVNYENTNDGSGNYHFSYETSNGISRDETGTLVNAGQPDVYIEVQGTLSYIGPDGVLISVRYSADKNGYHIVPTDMSYPATVLGGVPPQVVASLLGAG